MKFLITLALLALGATAADNIIHPKKCETFKLSNYTSLISCHDMSYLVEYQDVRRDDEESVKKITIITTTDKKTIISR